jgi:DNA polymerase III delta prime subunit
MLLSHHAYCLIGDDSTRAELLSILEKKQKIKTHGNPDFFNRVYETFTIDDARGIKSLAETKPVTVSDDSYKHANDNNAGLPADRHGKKIFVLTMNGITVEAQNAMLKLLEEPPEYTHFFLIIPSVHLLLPTVKSRLSIIDVKGLGGERVSKGTTIVDYSDDAGSTTSLKTGNARPNRDMSLLKEAEAFLKAPAAKRLETIKSLMDSITKEKKTKQDAIDLINAIEAAAYLKAGARSAKELAKVAPTLETIQIARKYMNDRSPSMKMLLEYVALNV